MKPVFARQMEVYAGFLEHTDHHVGRLIDALGELEILDDTLVYLTIGDNGASAESTPNGCFDEIIDLNGAFGLETVEFMTSRIDDLGTPKAYNHYAVGWAHAMDTPFQWTRRRGARPSTSRCSAPRHLSPGLDRGDAPQRSMVDGREPTARRGSDSATPVTDDIAPGETEFTGRVNWVEIDLGDDAAEADHLITPEERLRVAMARQ